MLTPNDIRESKKSIKERCNTLGPGSFSTRLEQRLMMELFEDVLKEISKGSIDPKSLAIATLEPAQENS